MIRILFKYVKEYPGRFTLAILLAAGTILAGTGLMSTSGYLISRAAQRPMLVDLFMVTAAVRFFGISRAVVRYFERFVSHDLTFRILMHLRVDVFKRIISFSQKVFMSKRPGDLLSGVISDVETLQNAYLRIIAPSVTATIVTLITLFVVSFFGYDKSIITLLFLLISGILIPLFAKKISQKRGRDEIQTQTELNIHMVDQLQGIHDIQWMNNQQYAKTLFNNLQQKHKKVQSQNAFTHGIVEGLNNISSHLALFFVLLLMMPEILNNTIGGVWLAAVVLGVLSSFEAVQGMATAFINYENSVQATKRLFTPNLTNKNISTQKNKVFEQEIEETPHIRFENVYFSYDTINNALHNISFSIPPGSQIAVVGSTGSGKSTILNLLLKYWEPQSGNISLNGTNLTDISGKSIKKIFGITGQSGYVFSRSIRDNLTIADPNASTEQLKIVLHQSGLSSLVNLLDEDPGSLGRKLSGGETKMLLIARLLLKQSHVWVLDEPTANMDIHSEKRIMQLIRDNKQGRTIILMTHRLVNMQEMDQILVMNKGKIVESGTHDELILKKGRYETLYSHQMNVLNF